MTKWILNHMPFFVVMCGIALFVAMVVAIMLASNNITNTQADEQNELIEYLPENCRLGDPVLIEWTGERTYPRIRYEVLCEGATP